MSLGFGGEQRRRIDNSGTQVCRELQELKRQVERAQRAYLEMDERAKGTFSNLEDARLTNSYAQELERKLHEMKAQVQQHCDKHGCS
jgi:hypothetical protein